MYPHELQVAGYAIAVWNALFAIGVVLGWLVFLRLARREAAVTFPTLRFFAMAYLSALAAQMFAYAFDVNTTMAPPFGYSAWEYYLSPVAGPKTLYGVIVLMPVSVGIATRGCRISLARALDLWTVPMLVVLTAARVGCLLQGCCFGMRSDGFGMAFPAGSPVWSEQRIAGLVADGAAWSLPVVPTQAIEAAMLAMLAVVCAILNHRGAGFAGDGIIGVARCGGATSAEKPAKGANLDHTRRDGRLFLFAVTAYSIFRFAVEFVRADAERGIYGGLATSQWIALVVIAVSVLAAWRSASSRSVVASAPRLEEAARR